LLRLSSWVLAPETARDLRVASVGRAVAFVDATDQSVAEDVVIDRILVDAVAKAGRAQGEPHQPGLIDSMIYHMIKMARHRTPTQRPIPGEAARGSGMMPPTGSEMISPTIPG
jgi:hypothetical protein